MTVRLGDIFTITSGGTPDKRKSSYYDGGTIPWVKTGDLKDKYIPEKIECITEDGLNHSSAKLFPRNTVLLAMYGATIGACSILPFEASTNQACAAFLPNEDVLPSYLYYFLCSMKEHFIKDGVGGAQPNISAGYLKNVSFTMRPMSEQLYITTVLDKVSDLITLRKQQLDKLDELVKARFVEMFGDPYTNPKKYLSYEGKELFVFSSGKFLEESKRKECGFPVYGGNGIVWYTDESLITYETLIIGRVGAYCGNVKLIKKPVWITDNAIYIKAFKKDCFDLDFLYMLMFYLDFSRFADYSGQPKITQRPLESLKYITPPIDEQLRFSAFVEQIDKFKLTIHQGLGKMEVMKKALMQEYFGRNTK